MTNIYMACAAADMRAARAVVNGLAFEGRAVWWDEAGGGADAAARLDGAGRVIVGWSRAARRDARIRAEALEALDAGRLIQLRFDRSRPPPPFDALPAIRFSEWDGSRGAPCWRALMMALGQHSPVSPLKPWMRTPLVLADAITGASRSVVILSLAVGLGVPALIAAAARGMLSAEYYLAGSGFLFGAALLALGLAVSRLLSVRAAAPRERRRAER